MIGFDVGGGYDLYARTVARHLTKHIPGNPVFVPQNMPGAGSRVAANWLYNVAAKDGPANDHAEFGDRPDAAGARHSLRRGEAQLDRQSDGGQPGPRSRASDV